MYSAKIILDSISPAGRRLTTWELTYPRMVHAELMTHRIFSRNSASSRAIPNEKLRERVQNDPALPLWWGKNQAGMQAREELRDMTSDEIEARGGASMIPYVERQRLTATKEQWLAARDQMLKASENLASLGLHKQLCNRLIEPWMFITVIVSATTFDNWFHLRNHKDAQPEIAWVAREMYQLYHDNRPTQLKVGEWHLPFVREDDRINTNWTDWYSDGVMSVERANKILCKVSTGRCARVSYLTHDGKRDLKEDVGLHDKLLAGVTTGDPLHMSPFEHVAQALENPDEPSGNFRGWKQYRKTIPGEHHGEVLP